ncbi:MAG: hypothetical protein HC915_01255 [Anaerolineae bacterium]|nr:hypothetical protein [Anaerolineae bacterium]
MRQSPSLEVQPLLASRGAQVTFCDPDVASARMHNGETLHSVELSIDWLQAQNCVVILKDHRAFNYALWCRTRAW